MASAANDSRFETAEFNHQNGRCRVCDVLVGMMAGKETIGKAPKPYSFESLVAFRLGR
jgi:hypothetical protein